MYATTTKPNFRRAHLRWSEQCISCFMLRAARHDPRQPTEREVSRLCGECGYLGRWYVCILHRPIVHCGTISSCQSVANYWDCKGLLATSLTYVSNDIASVQTVSITFKMYRGNSDHWSETEPWWMGWEHQGNIVGLPIDEDAERGSVLLLTLCTLLTCFCIIIFVPSVVKIPRVKSYKFIIIIIIILKLIFKYPQYYYY